jgi:hypothetical protein
MLQELDIVEAENATLRAQREHETLHPLRGV